jgi:hypothetical protein
MVSKLFNLKILVTWLDLQIFTLKVKKNSKKLSSLCGMSVSL